MHPRQKLYFSGRGIVYFIQPVELLGTNRYKVGRSDEPTLNRPLKGYKKGSRYLIIMECEKPRQLEKILLDVFHKKFTCIAGNEYFEGDEDEMKQEFQLIVRMFESGTKLNNVISSSNRRSGELNDSSNKIDKDSSNRRSGELNDSSNKIDKDSLNRRSGELNDSSNKIDKDSSNRGSGELNDSSNKIDKDSLNRRAGELNDSSNKIDKDSSNCRAGELNDSLNKIDKDSSSEDELFKKISSFSFKGQISNFADIGKFN